MLDSVEHQAILVITNTSDYGIAVIQIGDDRGYLF